MASSAKAWKVIKNSFEGKHQNSRTMCILWAPLCVLVIEPSSEKWSTRPAGFEKSSDGSNCILVIANNLWESRSDIWGVKGRSAWVIGPHRIHTQSFTLFDLRQRCGFISRPTTRASRPVRRWHHTLLQFRNRLKSKITKSCLLLSSTAQFNN